MSDLRQQISELCNFNKRLARDGSLLRLRVRNQEIEIAELKAELAATCVERDAIDVLLAAAVDDGSEGR